jgi:hypothetical protein
MSRNYILPHRACLATSGTALLRFCLPYRGSHVIGLLAAGLGRNVSCTSDNGCAVLCCYCCTLYRRILPREHGVAPHSTREPLVLVVQMVQASVLTAASNLENKDSKNL